VILPTGGNEEKPPVVSVGRKGKPAAPAEQKAAGRAGDNGRLGRQ
jgi:hypothetical protein